MFLKILRKSQKKEPTIEEVCEEISKRFRETPPEKLAEDMRQAVISAHITAVRAMPAPWENLPPGHYY